MWKPFLSLFNRYERMKQVLTIKIMLIVRQREDYQAGPDLMVQIVSDDVAMLYA